MTRTWAPESLLGPFWATLVVSLPESLLSHFWVTLVLSVFLCSWEHAHFTMHADTTIYSDAFGAFMLKGPMFSSVLNALGF